MYIHAGRGAVYLLTIVLTFCFQKADAQKYWTLSECEAFALKNNISVKRLEVSTGLAEVNHSQNKYALLPTLNASAGRNWSFGRNIDPFTNQFTTDQVESDNLSLNSGVTLFSGFQLTNALRQSKLEYLAARSDLQKIRNDVSVNVVSAYLQMLYAGEQLKVASARVEQSTLQRERISKMVEAGTMVQGNLLEVETQLANEELARITSENQFVNARLTLTQLMQLPSPEGFLISDPGVAVPDSAPLQLTPAQIYELALSSLPEVKAADARIAGAEKALSVARGGLYPRLTAFGQVSSFYSSSNKRLVGFTSAGYFWNGELTTGGDSVISPVLSRLLETNPYNDQLDQNLRKAVGVSLSIPLFNGWSNRAGIQRARLNLENARLSADQTRNQLFQSIQQAHADALAAAKRLDAVSRNMNSFEKAYEYAGKRFEAGLSNSLDYLNATTNLTRARIELLQARYDYIFRLKVLDFYAGKPLAL